MKAPFLCRLVINPTTKQPKGTAFVEFEDPAKAKNAADASASGRYNHLENLPHIVLSNSEAAGLKICFVSETSYNNAASRPFGLGKCSVTQASTAWQDEPSPVAVDRERLSEGSQYVLTTQA